MSKYQLGDHDYVPPGSGSEALQWEIERLKTELGQLKELITELADMLSAMRYADLEDRHWTLINKARKAIK